MDHRISRHDMYQKKAEGDDNKDRHKGRRNFLCDMTGHMYVLLSHKSGRSALRPPAIQKNRRNSESPGGKCSLSINYFAVRRYQVVA